MTQSAVFYNNEKLDNGEVETLLLDMHDPKLYWATRIADKVEGGFDAIGDDDIACYNEQGYLAVEDAFTPDEVRAALAGLLNLIGGGRPDFKGVQFEAAARGKLDTLSIDERQDAVRKLMAFVDYDSALRALAFHPKLLDTLKRIFKTDREPIMFQDMALLKPPRFGREKPWHQDKAYFDLDKREQVIGVWVALDEATLGNGCMHLMPQLGREPIAHFKRRDWQVCDTETLGRDCVAVPLRPGGILFFDGLLVHGTPHNNSAQRRRAVQFHYRNDRYAKITTEQRMEMFGSEGKDAYC